jgi:hypothetical protein
MFYTPGFARVLLIPVPSRGMLGVLGMLGMNPCHAETVEWAMSKVGQN